MPGRPRAPGLVGQGCAALEASGATGAESSTTVRRTSPTPRPTCSPCSCPSVLPSLSRATSAQSSKSCRIVCARGEDASSLGGSSTSICRPRRTILRTLSISPTPVNDRGTPARNVKTCSPMCLERQVRSIATSIEVSEPVALRNDLSRSCPLVSLRLLP